MVVGAKDALKLVGVSVIACCAVFVCAIFLNYNLDLASVKDAILTEEGRVMYGAVVSMGKVTAAVTGLSLVLTAFVMLTFYIKNYLDTHGKEMGVLKAMGYSELRIAKNFWIFGFTVLIGCIVGYAIASIYIPSFYKAQNADGLFPEIPVRFHPVLASLIVVLPTLFFCGLSVLYAYRKLKTPVLELLRGKRETAVKIKAGKGKAKDEPFLKELKRNTLKKKKIAAFFVCFSAFCFSCMLQMSFAMNQLTSENFVVMIVTIGLILSYMTLFLSLSAVVKANYKTIAMMKAFGYTDRECAGAVLGVYRPISYIGFAIGTLWQWGLLKIMVTFVFAGIENMPEYRFSFVAMAIVLAAFIVSYELVMYYYLRRLGKASVKSIMLE